MTEPLVSVVMGVYNGANELPVAIESILTQTFSRFEFLIINDGSTDETPRILESYASQDSRIRIITQSNAGLTESLIRGCEEAAGKYIARQDADDASMPNRLQQQVDLIERDPRLAIVSGFCQVIGPRGERLDVIKRPLDAEIATAQLLEERQGPPAHGTVLFTSQAYKEAGGYRRQFYFGQDADLWMRMCEDGLIGYVDSVVYRYSFRPGNISTANEDLQSEFGRLGQACKQARRNGDSETPLLDEAEILTRKIRDTKNTSSSSKPNLARGLYFIGAQLAAHKDRRAIGYLWQTIKANPLHWRAWFRMAQTFLVGQDLSRSDEVVS